MTQAPAHLPQDQENEEVPAEGSPVAPDATTENPDGTVPDYGTE